MPMDSKFLMAWSDGNGFIAVDWSLAIVSTLAALFAFWRISANRDAISCKLVGEWLIALGFGLLSVRLFSALLLGSDPLISLPGLVSLMMVGAGWILVVIERRP